MIYHFDTADARTYGTDEAILLYNVVGWLRVNKAEGRNQFDGHTWTYNTARALVDVFDNIWSEDQIRRLIRKLTTGGVLLKGNYNREVGRRADDRTLWLALADEARIQMPKPGKSAKKEGDSAPEKLAEPPANSPEACGEIESGLRRNCGTPPANSPDIYKEQKETFIGETASEKPHKTLNVGDDPHEYPKSEPLQDASATLNAPSEGLSTLFSPDLPSPDASPPLPTERRSAYGLSSRPPSPTSLSLKAQAVEQIVSMTGDAASRLRFEQVYDLAEAAGHLLIWEKARGQTRKAIHAAQQKGEPINPGKYFNGLVARLLNEAHPGLIPTGSREEREAVHAAALESLAIAGNQPMSVLSSVTDDTLPAIPP